jgi:acyl dehydratase
MANRLADGVHDYAALAAGDWYETGELTVEASHIDRFADVSGDLFEIHMSDTDAQTYGFPGRVAHGLLVLSLVDGLKNRAGATFRAIASLGWTWSFRKPVFIGDVIRARITILEKRETRNPERGILRLGFAVTNQDGVVVQDGENQLMVYR